MQMFLPQKDHRHGLCMLDLFVDILQAPQEVLHLWVSVKIFANKYLLETQNLGQSNAFRNFPLCFL